MGKELTIQVGAAKVPKYATSESGDTLELIERPQGGISAVLVDGQRSGRAAKIVSNIVARKVVSLIGEGVRDGAVARAAHDYLRTHRSGQVSAELQIISVDLVTRTVVISRNTRCPTYLVRQGRLEVLEGGIGPIGVYPNTKPTIAEFPLAADTYAALITDGVVDTVGRGGVALDVGALLLAGAIRGSSAQQMADEILAASIVLNQDRPHDDSSVLILAVLPSREAYDIRRSSASYPA
jgi:serine phosphatase RsbU (regulator of sigma subunit)